MALAVLLFLSGAVQLFVVVLLRGDGRRLLSSSSKASAGTDDWHRRSELERDGVLLARLPTNRPDKGRGRRGSALWTTE